MTRRARMAFKRWSKPGWRAAVPPSRLGQGPGLRGRARPRGPRRPEGPRRPWEARTPTWSAGAEAFAAPLDAASAQDSCGGRRGLRALLCHPGLCLRNADPHQRKDCQRHVARSHLVSYHVASPTWTSRAVSLARRVSYTLAAREQTNQLIIQHNNKQHNYNNNRNQ